MDTYAWTLIVIAMVGLAMLVPWIIHDMRKAEATLGQKKRNRLKYRWKSNS
jgi:hypothetical protein